MANERLYSFAVVKHPTEKGREEGEKSVIVVPPSDYILAQNEQEVVMLATLRIPQEELKYADRLEVAVSPF